MHVYPQVGEHTMAPIKGQVKENVRAPDGPNPMNFRRCPPHHSEKG